VPCRLVVVVGSTQGGAVRRANRLVGAFAVPVASRNNNGVRAHIAAVETEIVVAERAVRVVEVSKVGNDGAVIADLMTRGALKVVTEAAERREILLEDNRLRLHVADLLSDYLLSHFLQNGEALLNDRDGLAVADNFLGAFFDDLVGMEVIEVVRPIEAIEVVERRDAMPAVERDGFSMAAASSQFVAPLRQGRRHDPGGQSRCGNQSKEDFCEHCE